MLFIQDDWSLNNTLAGILFSITLAGYAMGSLLIIPLTDKIGPKPILLNMLILSVVSHLLFPLVAHGIIVASILCVSRE